MQLALLTSNCSSRRAFFRAGGIRFIADLIPYFSSRYRVDFYVAGREDDEFTYRGARIHIVRSRKIPMVDKRFLPRLDLDADMILYLDYVAALSRNRAQHSATVFHHLARSFRDENPALYRKYFGRAGQRYLLVERVLLHRVMKETPIALSVSDVTPPYLRDLGFSVTVVGNGIDVRQYRSADKEDYAVVVGRLVNYKRVEWALQVSEALGIPLKVIGVGPLQQYLQRIAPKTVEFMGYVDEAEKIRILSHAKYLFAFSAFEGFDLPVIEAMAAGAVPVMSNIRAHRYILSGMRAGVVVNSVGDAISAVRQLERDDDLYDFLSRAGRRLVQERWDAEIVARKYFSVIQRVVGA